MIAGFAAVFAANVVIVCYIVMAFYEDEPEGTEPKKLVPVGIWAPKKTD
jgi:hypothetical protein